MISPRHFELPLWHGHDFNWGLKPVLSYSKPHNFSTFLGEENKFEQNDRKAKRSIIKKKGVKKRILSTKVFFLKSSQVRVRRVWARSLNQNDFVI